VWHAVQRELKVAAACGEKLASLSPSDVRGAWAGAASADNSNPTPSKDLRTRAMTGIRFNLLGNPRSVDKKEGSES
jgi:hypothetical protein